MTFEPNRAMNKPPHHRQSDAAGPIVGILGILLLAAMVMGGVLWFRVRQARARAEIELRQAIEHERRAAEAAAKARQQELRTVGGAAGKKGQKTAGGAGVENKKPTDGAN